MSDTASRESRARENRRTRGVRLPSTLVTTALGSALLLTLGERVAGAAQPSWLVAAWAPRAALECGSMPASPPPPPAPPPYEGAGPEQAPAAPQPAGPTSPGAPASSPGPAGGVPGGGAQGPLTPSTSIQSLAVDYSDWRLWWRFNKWSYMDQMVAERRAPRTRAGEGLQTDAQHTINPVLIRERVLPALLKVLADGGDERMQRAALIAIARIGEDASAAGSGAELSALLEARVGHSRQAVSETAILALGVLADTDGVASLASLLADDESGRALLGRLKVPTRVRALAAYSLGFAGSRCASPAVLAFIGHRLMATLVDARMDRDEIRIACLHAASLLPVGSEHTGEGDQLDRQRLLAERIDVLVELLEARQTSRSVRAHLPTALARLVRGEEGALKVRVAQLLIPLSDKRKERDANVRRSALAGLGLIGDSDRDPLDVELRKALENGISASDGIERDFAALALAQVAGRPGAGEGGAMFAAESTADTLLRKLSTGKSRQKPWVGVALGLLGKGMLREGGTLAKPVAAALRLKLDQTGSPLDAGAYCIGVGLSGDASAIGTIVRDLHETHDEMVRADIALSVGLIGKAGGREVLRDVMVNLAHHPDIMEQAALGRWLLADTSLVPDLLTMLPAADNWQSLTGVVKSMGWTRDARVILPLLEVLADEGRTAFARAAVIESLGALSDESPFPISRELSVGINYTIAPASLTDQSGFGVLDVL